MTENENGETVFDKSEGGQSGDGAKPPESGAEGGGQVSNASSQVSADASGGQDALSKDADLSDEKVEPTLDELKQYVETELQPIAAKHGQKIKFVDASEFWPRMFFHPQTRQGVMCAKASEVPPGHVKNPWVPDEE